MKGSHIVIHIPTLVKGKTEEKRSSVLHTYAKCTSNFKTLAKSMHMAYKSYNPGTP